MESVPDIFGRAFQVSTKERLLRDPLHGLIALDENLPQGRLLVQLIDSAEFQRLRRIRQLGLANYAFHGAEHSRFTHSMGAYYLLGKIVDQLGRMYAIDSELAFYAGVAALVHDVGHGPLSHVSERIFGIGHEKWTVRILHDEGTEIHQILSEYSPRLPSIIESMLTGMAKPGYLCSLVNSQLDADRFDYLLRDSLMTGVKYGVFDIDRLIHMLRISPEGEKIIVAHGGLGPIEKYIQARYHMYRQVYLHKTVTAAEAMLTALMKRAGALIREGKDAGLEPGSVVGRALTAPEELSVSDFLMMDDVELMGRVKQWSGAKDSVLSDIAARMLKRRLFKTIEVDPAADDFERRLDAARGLVRDCGLDPDYYLIRVESSDTPYAPYDPSAAGASDHILIEDGKGRIVDAAEVSPTIRAFTESVYTLSRIVVPESHGEVSIRDSIKEIFDA